MTDKELEVFIAHFADRPAADFLAGVVGFLEARYKMTHAEAETFVKKCAKEIKLK